MKEIFRGLILSIQLFTRIPLNIEINFSKKNINWAMFFFPLVGSLIGVIVGLCYFLLLEKSMLMAAAISFLLYLLLTGGLHLDGLSDMVDGFLSNKNKEETIKIMQDSFIGAFGVLSLISYSIIKVSLYASIYKSTLFLIPLACMVSRLATINLIFFSKLGPSGGFGKLINDSIGKDKKFILLTVFIIAICLKINFKLIIPILGVIINTMFLNKISTKKIGGVTGDIYGACTETSDLIFLFLGILII